MVAGREEQIVGVVLICGIWSPELLGGPWNISHMQRFAVIDHRRIEAVHRENMIVFHFILVAVIIARLVMIQIVGRIDIDFAFIDMGGRVRCIDVSYDRLIRLRWLLLIHKASPLILE